MNYHNPELYAATKSYVIAAVDLIRKRVPSHLTDTEIDDQTFFFARLHANDELETLTEYNQCLRVLTAETMFARQLGVLAGPRGGPRSLSPDAKGLMWQFPDLGLPSGSNTFDEAYFEEEYADLEKAYYDGDIEYHAIAPLNGFIASGPIELSDGIEIVELRPEDFAPTRTERADSSRHPLEKVFAVSTRYALPKALGEAHVLTPQHRDEDEAIRAAANEQIAEVVTALRLCGIESVYIPGIMHKTTQWSFGRSRSFPGQFIPDIRFSMTVDADWIQQFKECWNGLHDDGVKRRKFLLTAVRRFGYAHERYRSEDKIIDLLIAAEALFLSDSNYTGEIKYRLAQRTAFFLAEAGDHRKTIFERMKAAYDFRSATAHGGNYKKPFPKKTDGTESTMDEFVWQIQEYVQRSILRAIYLASQPDTPLHIAKWDDLIFHRVEG